MAIDTATKRFSMMDVGGHSLTLPVPSGSFDAGDRLHLLDMYSGLAAAVPTLGPFELKATAVFQPGTVALAVFQPGAIVEAKF